MSKARIAQACLFALLAASSCYQGKSDVARMSSYGTGGDMASSSSGGPGGASTSSSTSSGAGGAGTGGADPCANAIFCDDFEGHPTGGPPGGMWDSNAYLGTITVDAGRARSGQNAVKISADAAQGYRSVMISLADPSLLPVAGNVVYGRMMFYLESAPDTTVHWTFIDGAGPIPGQGYSAVYRYGGQHPITQNGTFAGSQLMANYETPDFYQSPPVGPGSDCWLHSDQKAVPTGAWTCAEWMFDGPNTTMRFWLNGAELTDLTMTGTGQGCVNQAADYPWSAPSFERIDLGWESYQDDGARVIWIDDVALGTQRLGCPK